jgi:hypothetical protein
MSALGAFCNQLVAFFEDLVETYPEEKEIVTAAQSLKLLKRANPRLMHTVFMDSVHKEFAQHILDENEEFILRRSKEMFDTEYSDMSFAFWIFHKHWSSMSETNKQHVWKYVKSLILLARKVEATKPHS